MKKLTNPIFVSCVSAGLGVLCLAARLWMMKTGIDSKDLLVAGHPGDILSWVLTGLLAVLLGAAVFLKPEKYGFQSNPAGGIGAAVCALALAFTAVLVFTGQSSLFIHKITGKTAPLSYALAALEKADSPLRHLFEKLLQEQYGKRSRVGEYRFYDHGGVGVEIGKDIVLVGNLSFIRSMGVHMPSGARVRQAIYVSVNGELAGIFALKYRPNASTRDGLRDVLSNRNFSIILATRDFLITPELIAAKYNLPTETMGFPDYTERLRLSATDTEQALSQGALIAEDTFGALAVTVAAGRTLKNCALVTTALTLCAGALGLLLTIFLIAWGAPSVASPIHIASFQLLWGMVTSFIGFILLRF